MSTLFSADLEAILVAISLALLHGQMGALKWALKATLCNLRTIVYNRALLMSTLFLRGTFVANDDNRGQSWTIVEKYLKPPFAKPPFRLSQELLEGRGGEKDSEKQRERERWVVTQGAQWFGGFSNCKDFERFLIF